MFTNLHRPHERLPSHVEHLSRWLQRPEVRERDAFLGRLSPRALAEAAAGVEGYLLPALVRVCMQDSLADGCFVVAAGSLSSWVKSTEHGHFGRPSLSRTQASRLLLRGRGHDPGRVVELNVGAIGTDHYPCLSSYLQ